MTRAHWIFICTRVAGDRRMGREIISERLHAGLWPLNAGTQNQKNLKEGDQVIFYVPYSRSDPNSKRFVATAEIEGERRLSERTGTGAPSWLGTAVAKLYDVPLVNLRWFSSPACLDTLAAELAFIRNPQSIGSYLIGGVRSIPEGDFLRISQAGERTGGKPG